MRIRLVDSEVLEVTRRALQFSVPGNAHHTRLTREDTWEITFYHRPLESVSEIFYMAMMMRYDEFSVSETVAREFDVVSARHKPNTETCEPATHHPVSSRPLGSDRLRIDVVQKRRKKLQPLILISSSVCANCG